MKNIVEIACAAVGNQGRGDQSRLAEALGVSRMAVSLWKKEGRFPKQRIKQVSSVTGIPQKALKAA